MDEARVTQFRVLFKRVTGEEWLTIREVEKVVELVFWNLEIVDEDLRQSFQGFFVALSGCLIAPSHDVPNNNFQSPGGGKGVDGSSSQLAVDDWMAVGA
jgi:hypothetical protein